MTAAGRRYRSGYLGFAPIKATGTFLVAAFVVGMAFAAVSGMERPSSGQVTGVVPAFAPAVAAPAVSAQPQFAPFLAGSVPRVFASIPVGGPPQGLAYDSLLGETFVSVASGTPHVDVVLDATLAVTHSINVGNSPQTPAYDPGKGEIFVPNYGSHNVTVISDASNTAVANVAVGAFPEGSVYDPTQNEVFVADAGSATVSVISDTNNTVVKTINVGASPSFLAFDTALDTVYVTNMNSNNVSVISGATGTVVASVKVGIAPEGILYDPAEAELFVANFQTDSLSVIADANHTVVATVHLSASPWGLTFDTAGDTIYATLDSGFPAYGGNVSIVGGANRTVFATLKVGGTPEPASYDSARKMVLAGSINGTNVTVIAQTYTVLFSETGLPSLTSWNVSISGGPSGTSTGTAVSIALPNGSFNYTVKSSNTRYASPGGSVAVSGSGSTVSITFTLVTYVVTFTEAGLGAALRWNVVLGGTPKNSTNTTIAYSEANGSYPYSIAPVLPTPNNTTAIYEPSPAKGTANVSGGPLGISVHFTLVPLFPVTFKETGLPAGVNWSVTSGNVTRTNLSAPVHNPNSSAGSVAFNYANGTINFTFTPPHGYAVAKVTGPRKPTYSTANVSGPTTIHVLFGILTTVTFSEQVVSVGPVPAPPVGSWTTTLTPSAPGENPAVLHVTLSGANESFQLPKGAHYKFVITGPNDFKPGPAKGALGVGAAAILKIVKFHPVEERVLVQETGLPHGTKWCLNVTGPMAGGTCSMGTGITLHLVNGTYNYSLTATAGASFTPPTGSFIVVWAKATFLKVSVTGS